MHLTSAIKLSPPMIALISMAHAHMIESNEEVLRDYEKQLADTLWVLWRLGISRVVAQEFELNALKRSLQSLQPPPLPPKVSQNPLLDQLMNDRLSAVRDDLFDELPIRHSLELLPIPSQPLSFDKIKLCFQDELIGDPSAFLIHYGSSQFEVSGFHYPISAISVPIGNTVSVLLIARLPHQESSNNERETCVMELSSRGILLKGPWWPRLDR